MSNEKEQPIKYTVDFEDGFRLIAHYSDGESEAIRTLWYWENQETTAYQKIQNLGKAVNSFEKMKEALEPLREIATEVVENKFSLPDSTPVWQFNGGTITLGNFKKVLEVLISLEQK